jgi:hypothetical protein
MMAKGAADLAQVGIVGVGRLSLRRFAQLLVTAVATQAGVHGDRRLLVLVVALLAGDPFLGMYFSRPAEGVCAVAQAPQASNAMMTRPVIDTVRSRIFFPLLSADEGKGSK